TYDRRPMASGSVRHGLYEQLTLEAHAELSAELRLAGIGAVALLGRRAGVLSSSFTSSRATALQGHQQTFAYQWNSRGLSVSASSLRRSADFRDVPALLADSLLPRRIDQLFLGVGNTRSGQFSLSYVSPSYPGNPRIRLAGLGWSRSLGGGVWLSAQFHHDLGNQDMDSANVYFSMPLDRRTQFSSNLRHGADGNELSLQAHRSVPTDAGGWGWRAQASLGSGRSGSAELNHLSDTSQWRIGADHSGGVGTLGYADAGGSIVWFGNDLHALRRVDDAFALVSTNGVADVPVRLENRVVGHTDAHGQLLVTPLRAWQRNLIGIDPLGLPMDMLLGSPQQQVVPAAGSGARVDFKLQPSHPMRLQL
ncbi:MAG: fimbria/pilus outer membrane usher protein, partial [Stenotrophomonas sp.]